MPLTLNSIKSILGLNPQNNLNNILAYAQQEFDAIARSYYSADEMNRATQQAEDLFFYIYNTQQRIAKQLKPDTRIYLPSSCTDNPTYHDFDRALFKVQKKLYQQFAPIIINKNPYALLLVSQYIKYHLNGQDKDAGTDLIILINIKMYGHNHLRHIPEGLLSHHHVTAAYGPNHGSEDLFKTEDDTFGRIANALRRLILREYGPDTKSDPEIPAETMVNILITALEKLLANNYSVSSPSLQNYDILHDLIDLLALTPCDYSALMDAYSALTRDQTREREVSSLSSHFNQLSL